MSAWQLCSDAGSGFRWELSELECEPNGAPIQSSDSSSRLPSMADLLLQGCSKLLENRDEGVGDRPMFKTGLGKPVAVKQSSIAKALSVLGEGDAIHTRQLCDRDKRRGMSNSLFQTGSGKMLNLSSAGLLRAKTLLRLEEDNNHCTFQGLEHKRNLLAANGSYGWENSSHLDMREGEDSIGIFNAAVVPRHSLVVGTDLVGSKLQNEVETNFMQSDTHNSYLKPPPIKFHTAGGRSISISCDALQRAKSLLGDPELGTFLNEVAADDSSFSFSKDGGNDDISSNKENEPFTSHSHQKTERRKHTPTNFISPLQSPSKQVLFSVKSESMISGGNLIKKFDAVGSKNSCKLNGDIPCVQKLSSSTLSVANTKINNSLEITNCSGNNPVSRSSGGPLVDVSNCISATHTNNGQTTCEKRKLGRRSSVSSFKKPRSSQFSTPLNLNSSFIPNGQSTLSTGHSCRKAGVSSRYPFQNPRIYMKEYFGLPVSNKNMLEHARCIKSDNAEKYMLPDKSGSNCIGAEAFCHMLATSGASTQYASKEWVTNHYKWIVWKLACYERCYPEKCAGNYLTVANVLEELKYRYEREVHHGHRSAIKRILEGDASPSSPVVLCISAIHLNCDMDNEAIPSASNGSENTKAAKVELTDGWYSMEALLDVSLSEKLAAGKLFVGQKLRIQGAGICGWVGPISPLEVSGTVNLLLHINGTYRAHWAEKLGFCKVVGPPLAFRCIKSNGGPIPKTLVGVTRIYPVLYKERLSNRGSIVRSETMESKMMQLYTQRRNLVIEGIISDFQSGIKDSQIYNDSDSEEGAKILKILETAAEPEVIMADMSPEQLTSFSTYQAKLEGIRQVDMEKSIEKALQDAGLSERDITPFMRLRVVGLASKSSQGEACPREGFVTIWNPTEKQKNELVEGKAYAILGLIPMNSDSDILYLQTRGSTTNWQPLSPPILEHFRPFFSPRTSVSLSNLGAVPLSSEFDIAAYVVHVGEVHTSVNQKKQWVFVTDGSISQLESEDLSNSLLAISFCFPYTDDDSFAPINYNLAGSTVGFCNVIKRAKDQMNSLWVAEATENSTYYLGFGPSHCSHLRNAAASAQRWAKISSLTIDKLRKKILFIIGDCKG